ncbi:MAG: pyridoxamine 5'-phosphate oxidase, partial [Ilumatobacter sp.]
MMSNSIRDRRVQYETAGLDVGDLDANPIAQWQRWHDAALEAGVVEPNAMTLSTIGTDGIPDSRIVLVRGLDARGLVFYTNYDGAKSQQLDANPVASATFGWLDLHRQV